MTSAAVENGCDLSGDMIERLVGAMSGAIQTTMSEAFSFKTDIKPWLLMKNGEDERGALLACAIAIITANKRKYGTFVLQVDRGAALKILSLHGNGVMDEAIVDDAVCEIANMIFGVFKASVNKMGCQLTMQLPVPLHDKFLPADQSAATEKVVLPFMAEGHLCQAVLARA